MNEFFAQLGEFRVRYGCGIGSLRHEKIRHENTSYDQQGSHGARLYSCTDRSIMRGTPLFKQIAVLFFLCTLLLAQALRPERKVEGSTITSENNPAVRIHLPSSAQYVGADRWILYGVADCELHAFVEADGQKNVQRLYWVQFEGYVPNKPELKHTYDSPRHTDIAGMDFFVDTWVRASVEQVRPDSDREHIDALIRAKGYHMPAGMMYVRLVHLLDEQKRKELMIIYGEDVAPSGFTALDLQPNGKAQDQWPALEKGLIERAKGKLSIERKEP